MRTIREKENYKYSGILEADTIKQGNMKEINKGRIPQTIEKSLETTLCSWNLIKLINFFAVPIEWYLGPFLKRTREELVQMNQRTRKNKNDAPGFSFDRWQRGTICVKKESEIRISTIKDSMNSLIWPQRDNTKKNKERIMTENWQYKNQQNIN